MRGRSVSKHYDQANSIALNVLSERTASFYSDMEFDYGEASLLNKEKDSIRMFQSTTTQKKDSNNDKEKI